MLVKYDRSNLIRILCGLVTNSEFLAKFSGAVNGAVDQFDDPDCNLVAQWCVKFFREHGQAPNALLQDVFEQWATTAGEDQIALVKRKLTDISRWHDRHKDVDVPVTHLTDVAERYFAQVARKRVRDSVDDQPAEQADAAIRNYSPLQLGDSAHHRLFPIHTMDAIFSGPLVTESYLIDQMLVQGQPCIMAGPEKSMKTSLALDMSISLASGEPFLGNFEVLRPASCLLMSGESGVATLKKNLRTIESWRVSRFGHRRRLELWPKKLAMSTRVPQFDDPKELAALKELMVQQEVEVLFVDTASKAMPGDTMSNPVRNYELLAAVGDLCEELGVTFVLLHHTKVRKKKTDPVRLDDIMFSGFKEYFRQWILVGRREEYSPPEAEEPRLHRLWLNVGGSAGHTSLQAVDIDEGRQRRPRWDIELPSVSEAKRKSMERETDATTVENAERILSVLTSLQDGATQNRISEELSPKMKWGRLGAALQHLIDTDVIEECDVRLGNNQVKRGFRIISVQPSPTQSNPLRQLD